jgi:microcystin-dependent protein
MGGQPMLGEIQIWSGNFAPRGWAFCDGSTLAIDQNTALFSLMGTTYGGDGETTFGLPDLRGRVPVHQGQGPGLSQKNLGESSGAENVTLTVQSIPAHNHVPGVSIDRSTSASPAGNVWGAWSGQQYSDQAANTTVNPASIQLTGGGQPHNNMPPYLGLNFIIALEGVYPSRN